MNWLGLATDFDGTIADEGVVAPSTDAALRRLRDSGRRLVMVTGRELPSLHATYPDLGLFDRVVAENGGLLFRPADGSCTVLGPDPSAPLITELRARGVPISLGAVIVATWAPHHATVCEVITQLGVDAEVILNKGAVMVLPRGVDKATGLARAAEELEVPLASFVGVGDAENDVCLFRTCGLGVAVANALPAVKECADLVVRGERGDGVEELVERLVVGPEPAASRGRRSFTRTA
jgi:hypothetical protein